MLFVTYQLYSDAAQGSAVQRHRAGAVHPALLPVVGAAGQLADDPRQGAPDPHRQARRDRHHVVGGAGLMLANIPLMLAAVFAMGVHSTFFGPIKYAILPQHLHKDEVLGGTGLVEAGTYIAILGGTILAGGAGAAARRLPPRDGRRSSPCSASSPAARCRPPRRAAERLPPDWHIVRASIQLVSATMHIRAPVPGDLLDQLLLDHRRGADHHLPAAGEERARRRTSRSRACSSPSSRSGSRSARCSSTGCSRARCRRASPRPRCWPWACSCCCSISSRWLGQA